MGGTVRRSIIVTSEFKAKVTGINETERLAKAQRTLNKDTKKATSTFGTLRHGLTRLRIAYFNLAVMLGVTALAIRSLVKPSIELETSMVGVAKTTGLATEEIENLKDELIGVSKELPTSAKDLADIAKVAGQLGIAKEDINDFTRSVALIATVTNMTAEEAATNFAKLANAFNLPVSRIIQLGNVVNELENTTAATSIDIIRSLSRVGASATTLGISFEQSSAAVATLVSAGMRSERAGTRLRALFTQMAKDVDEFSKIAGISIKDFRKVMEEDADKALNLVIQGLIDTETGAINTAQAFDAAGRIGGFALITLANNVAELSRNMDKVNEQMDTNTSIINEMGKFLESTSTQWVIFKNLITADTLTVGDAINENMIKPLLEFLITLRTGDPFERFYGAMREAREAAISGAITPEQMRLIQESIEPLLKEEKFAVAAFTVRNLMKDFMKLNEEQAKVQETTKETENVFDNLPDAIKAFMDAQNEVIDVEGKTIEQREKDLGILEQIREEITEQFSNTYPNLLKVLQDVFNEEQKLIDQTQKLNNVLDQFSDRDIARKLEKARKYGALRPFETKSESELPIDLKMDLASSNPAVVENAKRRIKKLKEQTEIPETSNMMVRLDEIREHFKNLENDGVDTMNAINETALDLNDTLEAAVAPSVLTVKDALNSMSKINLDSPVNTMGKLADEANRLNSTGIAKELINLERERIRQTVELKELDVKQKIAEAEAESLWKVAKYGDFIARPGQPIQSFSPDDTIIGTKDPSSIINNKMGPITINVNGAQSPTATADEISRKLASLA